MADLSAQVRLALGRYWSEIYAGASSHQTTADLFSAIRDRASSLGQTSIGVGAAAVSTLRGYAGRIVSAANSLNAAEDSASLTAQHIAEAPWSRPAQEQATMPVYNVAFQNTIQMEDGSTRTVWQTTTITGTLPGTVGDLRLAVSRNASLLAAEGGVPTSGTPRGTSLGTSDLQITVV